MITLAFVDRKMLRRMLVIFGATMAQMVIVGAVVLLAIGLMAILLLIAASFVANVLAGVIALGIILFMRNKHAVLAQ